MLRAILRDAPLRIQHVLLNDRKLLVHPRNGPPRAVALGLQLLLDVEPGDVVDDGSGSFRIERRKRQPHHIGTVRVVHVQMTGEEQRSHLPRVEVVGRRTEERHVEREGLSTCRYRMSPGTNKTKKKQKK